MNLNAEDFQKYIGKIAKDPYGRCIGTLIGLSFDTIGQLKSVGIDEGENFVQYDVSRVTTDQEAVVITPEWKVEIENYRKETELIQREIQALDELMKNGEIAQQIYEEFDKAYTESLNELQKTIDNLNEKLKKRLEEIEAKILEAERFLTNIKIQHKTGEITDNSYTIASEYLASELAKDNLEKNDLQNNLASMETFSPKPMSNQQQQPEEVEKTPAILHVQTLD